MKSSKLGAMILCFAFLLTACGKESNEEVEVDKTSQDVPASERYATDYVEPALSEDEKFMDDVELTGKEVQFNLSNNLNTEFYLNGNVELCNYYNYGYTNETDFFCGQLTPVDGGYSDSWYLYFHRDSFDSVYKALLNGSVNMKIIAKIPSKGYKRGQGNMAVVQRMKAKWSKWITSPLP